MSLALGVLYKSYFETLSSSIQRIQRLFLAHGFSRWSYTVTVQQISELLKVKASFDCVNLQVDIIMQSTGDILILVSSLRFAGFTCQLSTYALFI